MIRVDKNSGQGIWGSDFRVPHIYQTNLPREHIFHDFSPTAAVRAMGSITSTAKDLSKTVLVATLDDGKGKTFAIDAAGQIIQLVSSISGKKEAKSVNNGEVSPEIIEELRRLREEQNKKDDETKQYLVYGGVALVLLLGFGIFMARERGR